MTTSGVAGRLPRRSEPAPSADPAPEEAQLDYRRPPRFALANWVHGSVLALTTWGVVLVAVGCGLLSLGWFRIAREAVVSRQLPYLVSAGFTGLLLVMMGVTCVNMGLRQRDQILAERHLLELTSRLEALAAATAGPGSRTSLSFLPTGRNRDRWAHVGVAAGFAPVSRAFQAVFTVVGLMLAGGFVCIGLTWYGVARTDDVARQLPYIASGGLFGLALVGLALVIANAYFRSWMEASRREKTEDVFEVLDRLVDMASA